MSDRDYGDYPRDWESFWDEPEEASTSTVNKDIEHVTAQPVPTAASVEEGGPGWSSITDKSGHKQYMDDLNAEAEYRSRTQDIEMRKTFADKLFWLVVFWLAFVALVTVSVGSNWWWYSLFSLDSAVLIALLTTATTTVLGLFGFVARYLFSHKPVNNSDEVKDDKKPA